MPAHHAGFQSQQVLAMNTNSGGKRCLLRMVMGVETQIEFSVCGFILKFCGPGLGLGEPINSSHFQYPRGQCFLNDLPGLPDSFSCFILRIFLTEDFMFTLYFNVQGP